ncbi:4Fe-4S dicluster domain-containing protein [Acidaminobacter sp. JC074]|uniref:nitroreductase family protein n=1 Tax=Acidaminobacter sp. JC074 TaxID=2530199 RepID=UPI001F108EF4|nr:nitroreductase family protein [Acidaminobacter sp. JC074]MCH4888146.1 4Fe-4S dicluster domain-containing protein [Acidaminobacter sp. JC074]
MDKKVCIDDKCIGCGLCVKDCPSLAIKIENNRAIVIKENCIMCGHCVAICPTEAVSIEGYDMSEVEEIDGNISLSSEELLHKLKGLRSIRHFKDQAVDDDIVKNIIEAGRYSSTAKNSQAVRYIVLKDQITSYENMVLPIFQKLQKFLAVFGNNYIKDFDFSQGFLFKDAPVVILVVAEHHLDAGLAAKAMELMADSYGLGSLYVGFFTYVANFSRKIKRKLSIGRKEKIVACLAVGYPDIKYKRTVPRNKAKISWM